MGTIPEGWYPDPDDPSRGRYWNGTGWTQMLILPGEPRSDLPAPTLSPPPLAPPPVPSSPANVTPLPQPKPPAPVVVKREPVAPEKIFLGAGVVFVLVAVLAFLAFIWGSVGPYGQAAVLALIATGFGIAAIYTRKLVEAREAFSLISWGIYAALLGAGSYLGYLPERLFNGYTIESSLGLFAVAAVTVAAAYRWRFKVLKYVGWAVAFAAVLFLAIVAHTNFSNAINGMIATAIVIGFAFVILAASVKFLRREIFFTGSALAVSAVMIPAGFWLSLNFIADLDVSLSAVALAVGLGGISYLTFPDEWRQAASLSRVGAAVAVGAAVGTVPVLYGNMWGWVLAIVLAALSGFLWVRKGNPLALGVALGAAFSVTAGYFASESYGSTLNETLTSFSIMSVTVAIVFVLYALLSRKAVYAWLFLVFASLAVVFEVSTGVFSYYWVAALSVGLFACVLVFGYTLTLCQALTGARFREFVLGSAVGASFIPLAASWFWYDSSEKHGMLYFAVGVAGLVAAYVWPLYRSGAVTKAFVWAAAPFATITLVTAVSGMIPGDAIIEYYAASVVLPATLSAVINFPGIKKRLLLAGYLAFGSVSVMVLWFNLFYGGQAEGTNTAIAAIVSLTVFALLVFVAVKRGWLWAWCGIGFMVFGTSLTYLSSIGIYGFSLTFILFATGWLIAFWRWSTVKGTSWRSSTLLWGPATSAVLIPAALQYGTSPVGNEVWFTVVTIGSVGLLILGAKLKIGGMFYPAAVATLIIVAVQAYNLISIIPVWVTFAVLGVVLLVVGVQHERSRLAAKEAAGWLRTLR